MSRLEVSARSLGYKSRLKVSAQSLGYKSRQKVSARSLGYKSRLEVSATSLGYKSRLRDVPFLPVPPRTPSGSFCPPELGPEIYARALAP